ncbi:MAG: PLP-dependent transferase [Acidimicrobiaceae bacterium]|nr:PLP-dependent transferase [Acidimicrobiaceae bacterium]
MFDSGWSDSTKAVSMGRNQQIIKSVNTPVSFASTYLKGESSVYGRHDNSTWRAFEEVIGELEGGHAVSFSSGQAATSAVFSLLDSASRLFLVNDSYNGTRLLAESLQSRGVLKLKLLTPEVSSDPMLLLADAPATADKDHRKDLYWLETPSNPMLRIYPLDKWASFKETARAVLVVDNTFASPVLQNPLKTGADLVVHSATKVISGHSDVIMGVVVARDERLADELREIRTLSGSIPGPMEAFLALRGTRTLFLRFERQQENAEALADLLTRRLGADKVFYPGLANNGGYQLARSQMRGSGYLISFDFGDSALAERFCDSLKLMTYATSLGGVETLVERRSRHRGEDATPPGLVRISAGIEAIEDLLCDLDQALAAVGR